MANCDLLVFLFLAEALASLACSSPLMAACEWPNTPPPGRALGSQRNHCFPHQPPNDNMVLWHLCWFNYRLIRRARAGALLFPPASWNVTSECTHTWRTEVIPLWLPASGTNWNQSWSLRLGLVVLPAPPEPHLPSRVPISRPLLSLRHQDTFLFHPVSLQPHFQGSA